MNYGLPYSPVCPIAAKQVADHVKQWEVDRDANKPPEEKGCHQCHSRHPVDELILHGYKTKLLYCKDCMDKRELRGPYLGRG